MKGSKKIRLGGIVMMMVAALWTGTGLAADIAGQITGASESTLIGAVVYLNKAGVSSLATDAKIYTIDPYDSDPTHPLGYYAFLNVDCPGSYIVTPDVPGYQFSNPSMYVKIDANGNITQINGTTYVPGSPTAPPPIDFTPIINGACSSYANGKIFLSAPTTLCDKGNPDRALGTAGPWSWICKGVGGTDSPICSATQTACGAANGVATGTKPTALCTAGESASSVGGGSGSTWTWTCSGSDSQPKSCSAPYSSTPVNGACGSSNGQTLASAPTSNLCSAGTASAVSGSGPWTWTCTGSNGGTTANCSASKQGVPGAPIALLQNDEEAVTLAAKQTQLFKFTTPTGGCSSALHKWIRITMINVSTAAGDGQLLVKSSNHGASTALPTLTDYTALFKAYGNGQDWTRDPNGGVFFWNWSIGAANEVLAILPTYTGHTFNQDDTYYMLLYNQGTTQNQYRVLWQCY